MSYFAVCPLSKVKQTVEAHKASHVLTVLSDEQDVPKLKNIASGNHKALGFNDIASPLAGHIMPEEQDVREIMMFMHGWDQKAPMCIHCWMGVSRATASAYIGVLTLNPDVDEVELANALRWAAPFATPNPAMIKIADDIMGRSGRMVDAIRTIGRGANAYEGTPFVFPLEPADLYPTP
ncbi:tyrosine phosphatase family protein [Ahrensia sp. 13_GOM-1096m]|uniref:tyrosine phosphatase family protein n=1 Tax=Ahrensia sp. 13_GOM-1096m TaxID=1380380 RepID=UPI00047AD34E|nr:tyrosine protein phosphatase [Ahrensia sp. 13_GOM-1096m]